VWDDEEMAKKEERRGRGGPKENTLFIYDIICL
jgi:hypothetical protein